MTKTARKLNIVMIGQKNVPSRDGGIDVAVGLLAPELVKRGNDVLLINRKRKRSDISETAEYKGCRRTECRTIRKKRLDTLVYAYFATRKAKKLASKGFADVIHFHAEGSCFFLYKFPKREKRNYKIVVTVHGVDSLRSKWKGLGSSVLKTCEKRIVKYADEIIVLSKKDQEYFLKKYGVKSTVIPNAAEEPVFRKANIITEKWGLEKNGYVLSLSRFVPEKGLHYLVEAFLKAAERTRSKKKLVLAGNFGFDKKYYKKILSACSGKDNIVLTGFVDGETMEELWTNAFLFVLPSEIEGMSMSLTEACAYKKPCLVSDIEENLAVTGEKAYNFISKNVDSLTEALTELLSYDIIPKTTEPSEATWEKTAGMTEAVYKNKL